ncbi:unnamed protein product [Triticum turgidum subsp. durum]|uniref:STML2-like C-terminal extension domain-containing protein n=1 Tax=Triticum turgidum subsp. durum TaxID=4567 RepID=A0A9R1A3U8_TRITD|nr:unnamed protein product [Triticum turgidum subsp. durum]
MFDTYHLFLTGAMLDQANRAKGEAEAILSKSQATAEGIRMVSESMRAEGSAEAAKLRIAEQYITAFAALAKNTTTMLLPSDAGNPSSMIAQSLQIYKHISQSSSPKGGNQQAEEVEEAGPQEEADTFGLPSVTSAMPPSTQTGHGSTFSLQKRKE